MVVTVVFMVLKKEMTVVKEEMMVVKVVGAVMVILVINGNGDVSGSDTSP